MWQWRKVVYYIFVVNFILVLVILLYAWSKLSYLQSDPLKDLLIILTLYQVLMCLCTVLLAKWVAEDGKTLAGEPEDYGKEGIEQRLSELERKVARQSKAPATATAWRCPKCQRANSSQAKTCSKCGSERPD